MAEIAASLVGPVIELGKCIVVPIKRQFHYLCCFDSNIKNLTEEAKKLHVAKSGIEMQIVEAENNGKIILPEVRDWLTSTDEIQVNVSGIETQIQDVQGGCSAIKSRFSISRKAEKMVVAIKQLQDRSKFNPLYVSQQPAAAAESVPLRQTYEFDSRKEIEEEIMTTLRGREINMIGLHGIGGVGKTTMAMRIMNRAKEEEHLFDEAVMVVVSQQVDLPKIQLEIAELLGLKFEASTLSARAHALRLRLKDGAKRTLVVLDDVWNKLELLELGIPCASGCTCTVLLTSRNMDAFTQMECKKVVGIQILSKSEAWLLFKEKAGAVVDDSNLLSVAEDVANECKGLPIALVTVGRALNHKEDRDIWKDALRQLRSSDPTDWPDVYKPIRLSYDFLEKEDMKTLFLLCCMFPEDYDIPVEDLTLYGWSLGIFEENLSLADARSNTFTKINNLKGRSLLIDGKYKDHVKMHDVVRDTGISIDRKREPRLHDLVIINISGGKQFQRKLLPFDDQDIKGKAGLNVLSISYRSLRLKEMQSLQQLRTLRLYECDFLDDISIVGELSNLEILSCRSCDSIKEIPTEIGRLNRLRLLEFLNCRKVEKIAAGVISQLVRLEELKIVDSFDKWEISGLKELESLCNLTCMEIEIMNSTLAKENLNFRQKIVKYFIRIGDRRNFIRRIGDDRWKFMLSPVKVEKKMDIEFPGEIAPGNWIHNFVKNGEALFLKGDGSKSLDLSQSQNLKWLVLDECSTMKKVVSTSSAFDDVFPFLEYLSLWKVDNLEEICDGSIKRGSNSFKNLRELSVRQTPRLKHLWRSPNQNVSLCNLSSVVIIGCSRMLNLFSLGQAKDCLPKLEELRISSCEMMEQVFCNEENENDGQIRHITFAKLERLVLSGLPKLATFCRGIGSIEFPVLTGMKIRSCPKLMSNPSSEDAHLHDVDSFHLFCNQEKVVFGNLKQLRIENNEDVSNLWCRQIPNGFFNGLEKLQIFYIDKISRCLFSASVAANLVNLTDLTIRHCGELVKVSEGEEDNKLFPKLETLELNSLPKLEIFCGWRCDVELPSLGIVEIRHCNHMKCFSLGSVSTPNLESFKIDRSEIIDKGDLNGALLQHYESKNKVEEDDETLLTQSG